jgi:extradiol dioxygenase family protein
MSELLFQKAIPILNVEKAKEFYIDFLGFTIDWEYRFTD